MLSIKKEVKTLYEIQKSKFYCVLTRIDSLEQVSTKLDEIKREYKDATHYCYAYILDNYKKCSDDGEPSGTAGLPILNVLEQNDLNHILCVVIRYFGGIKLGAGGLVRAYSKAVTTSLDKITLISLIEGYKLTITTTYENTKYLDYLLKKYEPIKQYDLNVTYTFSIPKDEYLNIADELNKHIISKELKEAMLGI